jgi:hypothetical protein
VNTVMLTYSLAGFLHKIVLLLHGYEQDINGCQGGMDVSG